MTAEREKLIAVRDDITAWLLANPDGVIIINPPPPPPPPLSDSNGLAPLAVVEALVASEGPQIDMGINGLNGAPNPPVIVPRKFLTHESVAAMPDGEDKVKASLSLSATELRQNMVFTRVRPPIWQVWRIGQWDEGDLIPGAVGSIKGAAWLGQAIVGRHRLIKQGAAQPHFVWLTDADHAAGA